MTCPMIDAATRDWTAGFRVRAAQARIPVAATLELTRRCNLRCVHCYLGDQAKQHRLRELELDTGAVKSALTEWSAAGCLYLTLTGGEPMVRPDFAEIYRHARELGMVVSVFCNGTRITDDIVALFRDFPPRKVEISLYGATAKTHEAVTRIPGSYAQAWAGIRRLREGGARVVLKTVLMNVNQNELAAMERQAAGLGCDFRYDAALFPCLDDGSARPLEFRVAPAEAVCEDMATLERRRNWQERIARTAAHAEDERLYTCAAGLTAFHADPFGGLSPCLMAVDYMCRPDERSFREIWNGELKAIRERRRTHAGGSFSGALRGACTHCPAFNRLETGDEESESDYMRQTTLLRYHAAMSTEDREMT